ncbi:MAG: serine/threonine-protein kinase [Pseudomonadota bacterium]
MNEVPKSIGPYRVLDVLGEGGMATVYLADQSEPVKRRVALKILKAGMDSKQVVARFESERQALAILDHPNIAKVFDGGMAESGRPYFVMERVKGVPITDYCDDQRLSNKSRIRLFIKVCAAVQHAHLKGLIHRDLKPSNILVGVVDGEPQPKIIDFGIAKATKTTLSEATLYTRVGQIIGTPAYMSPEQAGITGLDIDTRADIYSLGVVLYELLVGSLPLDVRTNDQAMQVALKEKDPPKPSTRFSELGDSQTEIAKVRNTEPANLQSQLKGDLDWVVMRAMEKDRTRRYETVNALAMECRRYLDREPVLARPPSAGYLLRRFFQRNKLTVVAGALALVAILAGAAAAGFGYLRATQAEKTAREEAESARQVADFMVELFQVSDPGEARGNSITAREVLDRGAERINQAEEMKPEIRARLLVTIGRVYQELGLYGPASESLRRSLEIQRSLPDGDALRLADVIVENGILQGELGDFDAARRYHEEALALRRTQLQEPHEDIVRSLRSIGVTYWRQDHLDKALDITLQAREMFDALSDGQPGLGISINNNLANIYGYQGDDEKAEPIQREILAARYNTVGEKHLQTGFSHDNLAITLDALGKTEEAETHYRKALQILMDVYGEEHPEVAQTMMNVASFLIDQESYDEAEGLLYKAEQTLRSAIGDDYYMVADTLSSLAYLNLQREKFEKAKQYANQAVAVYARGTLGPRHSKVVDAKITSAEISLGLKEYSVAEAQLKALESSMDRSVHNEAYEDVLDLLVELYTSMDNNELAETYRAKKNQYPGTLPLIAACSPD